MIKLFVGFMILLCLVLLIFGIRAYNQGNKKRTKKLAYAVSILGIIVDLLGLVLPGIDAAFDTHIISSIEQVITGDRNIGVQTNGDDNKININSGDQVNQGNVDGGGVLNQAIAHEGASIQQVVYVYSEEAKGYSIEKFSDYMVAVTPPEIPDDFYYVEWETFPTGWWDNSAGGRPGLTIEQINNGEIDDKIVFNSITDYDYYGDERCFVGVRVNENTTERHWSRRIEVDRNKSYVIRIVAHNNSRWGWDKVAEDVKVRFSISAPVHVLSNDLDLDGFDSTNGYWAVAVTGYITSSNAEPTEYSHTVKLVSHNPFHLEYIPYSAWFENNGIGAGGIRLSDEIIEDGVLIGFDELDGRIPGCYKYLSYSTIKVFPVFE